MKTSSLFLLAEVVAWAAAIMGIVYGGWRLYRYARLQVKKNPDAGASGKKKSGDGSGGSGSSSSSSSGEAPAAPRALPASQAGSAIREGIR